MKQAGKTSTAHGKLGPKTPQKTPGSKPSPENTQEAEKQTSPLTTQKRQQLKDLATINH